MSRALPTLCPPPPDGFPRFVIKRQPEDFVVEELPLYEPSGAGTHTYYWIEKRGVTTHDAVRRIAARIGKRAPDAGVAGLKDAQAVSRQWITFEHVAESARVPFEESGLAILDVRQHANKLKMGHLRGNRFIIRLRLDAPTPENIATLAARAREVLAKLHQRGVPNYFGPQRFGWGGDNVALGQMLVSGDEAGFLKAFASGGGRRPPDRKLRNLIVNAYQSDLFNQVLARRMPEIGALWAGDVAWLHRNGAAFAIANDDEATREQHRADGQEISPSGPIFGPKMLAASGRAGEIEGEILAASGVSADDFGRKEAERQPGARRPLRIFLLEEPQIEAADDGVILRFALPSGAYATVVIEEIARQPLAN